jgi:endonuclease/exonuclease/phosphatase (EEP) superfamily protein YafD
MLTPAQILLLIRAVLVALVLAALLGLGWYYRSAVARAEAAEAALSEATATAQATEATTGALSAVQTDTQRVEVVVTQGRAAAAQAVQELSNADPSIADLRATRIPDSLREIARQRREARDGSPGAPPGG